MLQSLFYLIDNPFNFIQFLLRTEHRIHNSQISKRTGTINCAKLCLEHFSAVQTQTDSSVSHNRINFIRDIHIICFFICTKICSPNHDQPVSHGFRNFLVGKKQFIFPWVIFPAKILEFTSQKPDSLCSVKQHIIQIVQTPCICIKLHLSAIQGLIFGLSQSQQFLPLLQILFLTDFIFFFQFFIRMHIQCPCISVYNCLRSIPVFSRFNVYQCRDSHCFCHNGSMGIAGTLVCHNGK